ncbi:MAG: hypothetical protein U1E14_14330 [Geminicoccaceae bacterium]
MSRIGGRLRKAVHREIAAQALVAHIDGKPLPENAVDAVIAVIDPPKAPKPRLLAGPIPPKLPTRRLPRRVSRRDGDDQALQAAVDALGADEREVLFGSRARAGPRRTGLSDRPLPSFAFPSKPPPPRHPDGSRGGRRWGQPAL